MRSETFPACLISLKASLWSVANECLFSWHPVSLDLFPFFSPFPHSHSRLLYKGEKWEFLNFLYTSMYLCLVVVSSLFHQECRAEARKKVEKPFKRCERGKASWRRKKLTSNLSIFFHTNEVNSKIELKNFTRTGFWRMEIRKEKPKKRTSRSSS